MYVYEKKIVINKFWSHILECCIEFRNEGPTALTHCFDTYYSILQ